MSQAAGDVRPGDAVAGHGPADGEGQGQVAAFPGDRQRIGVAPHGRPAPVGEQRDRLLRREFAEGDLVGVEVGDDAAFAGGDEDA